MAIERSAFDYDRHGEGYGELRRADPRLASCVHRALGDARTVLNVGAGAGAYEPWDRYVLAVEPSAAMRAQRPRARPALAASCDSLPFDDGAFDAAMATLTIHHWPDLVRGLREVRRVTRGPVVLLSFDPDAPTEFWMKDYVPEMVEVERRRYPALARVCEALGGHTEIEPVPVPGDCTDRFQVALYARPEQFLDPRVRGAQSAWRFLPPGVEQRFVRALAADLASGAWDERYGHLRTRASIACQLRLLSNRVAAPAR